MAAFEAPTDLTVNGKPDIGASYDSVGNEPDKQWITIDRSTSTPSRRR